MGSYQTVKPSWTYLVSSWHKRIYDDDDNTSTWEPGGRTDGHLYA